MVTMSNGYSIDGLRKYRQRLSIEDLPDALRLHAWGFRKLMQRRKALGKPTPQWTRAILMGQAKRLACSTPEERQAWARRMQARHGGLAVQRMYREQGRDTLTRARYIRALRQQERKRVDADDARRKQLGLMPPRRWKRLPTG